VGVTTKEIGPTVTASIPLYDHGRVEKDVRMRQAQQAAMHASVGYERETLNGTVVNWYTQALVEQASIGVLKQQQAVLKELLGKVRQIAEIDTGRRVEVTQLNTRLIGVQSAIHTKETNLSDLLLQISNVLELQKPIELKPLTTPSWMPKDEELAALLVGKHPALQMSELQIDVARQRLELSKLWQKPMWSLDVSVYSPHEDDKIQVFRGVSWKFGVSVPIFDGGRGASSADAEAQRLYASIGDRDQKSLDLKRILKREWRLKELRQTRLAVLKDQVVSADDMRKASRDLYLGGRRTLNEVITFEGDYFSALQTLRELEAEDINSNWLIISSMGLMSELVDGKL
jgi:outer membrane protein, adhesin transport system